MSNVSFSVGLCAENHSAKGMMTLFIYGMANPNDIISNAQAFDCKHIAFGTNKTFNAANVMSWEASIKHCLRLGYTCSLEFNSIDMETIHEMGLCEYNNFIPVIRVTIPYIKLLNYNAVMKIDDKDIDCTNPGVWTHDIHSLMNRNAFTQWQEYTSLAKATKESPDTVTDRTNEISLKHSIMISSQMNGIVREYIGTVKAYPGIVVISEDINYVYNELYKEIDVMDKLSKGSSC